MDYQYATCIHCGERWNISCKQVIPPTGYVCMDCAYRDRMIKNGVIKEAPNEKPIHPNADNRNRHADCVGI